MHLSSLEDLANSAKNFLVGALPVAAVDLLVVDGPSGSFRSLTRSAALKLLPTTVRAITSEVKPYPSDGLRGMPSLLRKSGFETYARGVLVPLPTKEGIQGLLLIGPLSGRARLTTLERALCTIVANALSVAFARILMAQKERAEVIRTAKIEKLAALGRLTAGIAHEFRNPLNIISTSAQTLLRNPDDVPLHREIARYILDEAGRLSRTVDEFLLFAKPHTPVWEPTRLEQVFDSVLLALRPRAMEAGIHLVKDVTPGLPEITTSPQHLERTLVNLGLNGIESMRRNGTLTLAARAVDGETVRIDVQDVGHGISHEHRPRLFDPFFTTKPDGTGLGLPIVFMLIQTIQGKISFTTGTGGTIFQIDLPVDGSRT